jgi:superfamily II DNA or RNA helicase
MSIKIYVDNFYSKIEGLSEAEEDILFKKLSYESAALVFMKRNNPKAYKMDTRKRLFSKKTKKIMTGLIEKVKEILKIDFEIIDNRIKPEKNLYLILNRTLPEMKYYQKEALEVAKQNNFCAVECAAGTGKTLLATHIIKEIGVHTLVIVPSLALLEQTTKDLASAFGGQFVGKHTDSKIRSITVANIDGLENLPEEFFKDFDMVLVDECHHSSTKTYKKILKGPLKHAYYKYFLSATNFRNDGTDLELLGVTGPVLYRYSNEQAIEDNNLNYVRFYIMEIGKGDPDYRARKLLNTDSYIETYKKYIVNNENRNNLIKDLVTNLLQEYGEILILVQMIEHGEILKNLIPGSIFINGETAENKKVIRDFDQGKIKVLISSNILNEGVNIVRAACLINAASMKAKSQVIQKVGRVMRLCEGKKESAVIDFIDYYPFLEDHGKARVRIYKKYNTEIIFI